MSVERSDYLTPKDHSVSSDASSTDSINSPLQTEPRAPIRNSVETGAEDTLRTLQNATEALLPMIDILAGVCQDLGALAPYLTDLGQILRRNTAHVSRSDNTIFDSEPAAFHATSNLSDPRESPRARQKPVNNLTDPSAFEIVPEKKPSSRQSGKTGTRLTSMVDSEGSDSESTGSSAPLITKRQKTNRVQSSILH
ncbi:uncharacterized protein KD926_003361 [Aspergillus affinis]|uniref:uncharacterized protein n=1 Tax=Aspergillus affinis TaxID=1070780 RepID=UPI0022FEDB06|nr:uncharacterized protein KD926_003361 [Aspergillus affinis]KAI9043591.1 hypothetical protein KD926_003361 [Aspergillus affinis]